MINKETNISSGENVSSLLLARVFDLLVLLIFLVISGFLIFHQPLYLLTLVLSIGVVSLWAIVFYRQKLSKFFSGLTLKNLFLNKFSKVISGAFIGFDQISNVKKLSIFIALSFAIWILDTLSIWAILLSVGFNFSSVEVAFVAVFAAAASSIPINLIGNFGTFEGTVAGGLTLLSVSVKKAFNLSFVLHVQTLIFSFVLFVFASWYRHFIKKEILKSRPRTHTDLYLDIGNLEKDFRNNNLTNLVLSLIKKGNLLDIGCGSGLLLSKATKENIPIKGLEPDRELVNLSRKFFGELNIVQTSLDNYESDEKFDNVVTVDILECFANYREALKKIVSHLKKDGRLILVAPAHSYLYGSRDKMMGYFRRFNKKDLVPELESSGLKIIKIRYWNMLGVLPYWLLYKVLKKESHFESIRGGKNERSIFSKFLGFWFKHVENKINLGFGLSLIIVAEK